MDEEALNCVTRKLIEPRPNTYTFTKAIAESLIVEECGSLPCAIVRPSIVGASWQEPVQVNDQVRFLPAGGGQLLAHRPSKTALAVAVLQ